MRWELLCLSLSICLSAYFGFDRTVIKTHENERAISAMAIGSDVNIGHSARPHVELCLHVGRRGT